MKLILMAMSALLCICAVSQNVFPPVAAGAAGWTRSGTNTSTTDTVGVPIVLPDATNSAQTIGAKLGEQISFKDKGAVGDGVTDDTVAIQSALNALTQGGTCYCPKGTYVVSAGINVPEAVKILGAGNYLGGCVIKIKASTTVPYVFRTADISSQGLEEGWSMQGVMIDGYARGGAAVTEAVLSAQKVFNSSHFRDIYIWDFAGGPGFWIGPGHRPGEGSGGVDISNIWINSGHNQKGIYISSYYTDTVTAATNATPIVLTTSRPHGLSDGDLITVASVGGNTNANGARYAKVTGYSTTTIGLYTNVGLSTPVAGNAAYTSGGTVQEEGVVQGISIRASQVEGSGTAPAVHLDSLTAGQVRQITIDSMWCLGTSSYCLQIDNVYGSTFSNWAMFAGDGQTVAVKVDNNNNYDNSFYAMSMSGGYGSINPLVDSQNGVTIPNTNTRLVQYLQSGVLGESYYPNLKAPSALYYACFDTNGKLVSQAAACRVP